MTVMRVLHKNKIKGKWRETALEKIHSGVNCAIRVLITNGNWTNMKKLIQKRDRLNVINVARALDTKAVFTSTEKLTREASLSSVTIAIKVLVTKGI